MSSKILKEIPTLEQIKAGEVEKTPLQKLLNSEPAAEWLKTHPTAKTEKGDPVLYLPIPIIDQLLEDIYCGSWSEITRTDLTPHSIAISLRLFVVNPTNGRTEHVDGIGAASSRIGIEAAAPIAESLAKKNAAKKLGRLFGRDLSREFEGMERQKTTVSGAEEVKIEIPEQKNEVRANPVKDRILTQIKKTKKADSLKAILNTTQIRLEQEQLNEEELEEIVTAVNLKLEKLK